MRFYIRFIDYSLKNCFHAILEQNNAVNLKSELENKFQFFIKLTNVLTLKKYFSLRN